MLPAALSFDLDGTLAEVRWRRARMWPAALRHGRVLTTYGSVVESLRGQRCDDIDAQIAAALAQSTGRSPRDVAGILAREIDEIWPALFAKARPAPAVANLLTRVDSLGIPRAVLSDHPALAKLSAMRLWGWSAVLDGRSLGALKPLPDLLHAAAAMLGVPVNRILHVGDRDDTDGAMAAAAGAAYISVADLAAGAHPLGRL